MSLLDDIERDAEANSRQQAIDLAAEHARAQLDTERVRGVLERIERHLRRAAQALNGASEPVSTSYELPGVGRLGPLAQGRYQVVKDPEEEGTLRFHLVCEGQQPARGVLETESEARAVEHRCVDAGLRCRRVAQGGERRGVVVDPRVPVSLRFHGEGGRLRLRTRNLFELGNRSYIVAPERVDEVFLEALLEAVMRRGERLAVLAGDRVDEAGRARLQRDLARRERRRRAELGGPLTRLFFPVVEAVRQRLLKQ